MKLKNREPEIEALLELGCWSLELRPADEGANTN